MNQKLFKNLKPLLLVFTSMVLVLSVNSEALADKKIVVLNDKNFEQEVLHSEIPVIVFITDLHSQGRTAKEVAKARLDYNNFLAATEEHSIANVKIGVIRTYPNDAKSYRTKKKYKFSRRVSTKIFFIPIGEGVAKIYVDTGRLDGFNSKQEITEFISANLDALNDQDQSLYRNKTILSPKLMPPSKSERIAETVIKILWFIVIGLLLIKAFTPVGRK